MLGVCCILCSGETIGMQIRFISILVLIFSGLQANFAWVGFGGGCSACSDKVCQVDSMSGCLAPFEQADHEHKDTVRDHSHEHGQIESCTANGGTCTCSLLPTDLPSQDPEQPYLFEHMSSAVQVPAEMQALGFDSLESQSRRAITTSLALAPPSHATRRARLGIWRT